jgi:hypothetical protein
MQAKVAQLNLFHPPQTNVRWESLPKEVQQQSTRLLARLLREYAIRQGRIGGKEHGDE